jgi:hypothetical protein
MSKVVTFILGSILGLLIGGAVILYFISPGANITPVGIAIQPPDPQGTPAGTAVIQLKQEFFTPVIQTILNKESSPAFPFSLNGQPTNQPLEEITCGKIMLKSEGSGTTTAVKMENGQILVPLAFAGNINAFGTCFEFNGWTQANLELRFEEKDQTVFGQLNVQAVNLDGVTPLASGLITPLVQSTINNRVNPVQILRADQIAMKIPIKSNTTTLQGKVKDIRTEIKDNSLFLYITYDFNSEKSAGNIVQ